MENRKMSFGVLAMCLTAALFYCYEYYLRVAPAVMRPELISEFNISDAGLGALVAFYYHAYVPLQIPVGMMIDKWGVRKILVLACLMCAIGTLVFASTNYLNFARVGRFFVGFGSAFAYVGVLKVADMWLPKKYFALIAGTTTALGMAGAMSGEIVMAKMVLTHGWRTSLYYAAFAGLLLTILIFITLKDKAPQKEPEVRVLTENEPLWYQVVNITKRRIIWINGLIGCLAYLPLTIFAEMWAVPFLESADLSRHHASIGSSLVFLGFGVGGPLWGALSDIFKTRKLPLAVGSLVSALCAFIVIMFMTSYLMLTYALLFCVGFFAAAQVIVFAVANDITSDDILATTLAYTNMIIMLGGTVFQPLVGIILDRMNSTVAGAEVIHSFANFQVALLMLPVGLSIAGVLSLIMRETHPSRAKL